MSIAASSPKARAYCTHLLLFSSLTVDIKLVMHFVKIIMHEDNTPTSLFSLANDGYSLNQKLSGLAM